MTNPKSGNTVAQEQSWQRFLLNGYTTDEVILQIKFHTSWITN